MGIVKQSTTSSSSAGIAVDSEERKAIDDVAVRGTLHCLPPEATPSLVARFDDTVTGML